MLRVFKEENLSEFFYYQESSAWKYVLKQQNGEDMKYDHDFWSAIDTLVSSGKNCN